MNEQMHLYLDDELPADERREFERHLAACPECMTCLTETEMAIQRVTSAEWLKAPANFTENLLTFLDEVEPPKKLRNNWRLSVMKYTGIASAALVVLATGMMIAQPNEFALQADNKQGLVVENGKVIVPEGQTYTGNLLVQNGDLEVRGKVNGNVTTLNGKIYRAAGADISGEADEVDEALEKLWFTGKQMWHEMTAWAR